MNQIFLEINACSISAWQLIAGLLLPFLLGYLFKRFLDEQYIKGYKDLSVENSTLKQEVSKVVSYKTSLTGTEKELKGLQVSIADFEKRNSSLKADLDAAILKLRSFEGVDPIALRSRIKELEGVNDKLNTDIRELSGSKSSLEDAAAGLSSLKANLSALQDENNRIKMDLRAALDAKEKVVSSNESIAKLKEEIRDMSGRVGGFTVESERLKKEAEDAKALLAGAKTEADAAKAATEATKNELAAVTQKLNGATSELNSLRAKASGADSELGDLRSKLSTATNELNSLRSKISGSESEIGDLKNKLSSATSEYNNLLSKSAGSDGEVNELKSKLSVATGELNNTKSKLSEWEGKAANLNSDLQSLQGKLSATENTKAQLQKALDECNAGKASVDALNTEISNLRGRLKILEEENSGLKVAAVPAPVRSTNDDLKLVEGIGPKIEQIFNKAGITTFRQLANTPHEKLKDLLDAEGPRYQMHDPYTWPRQSALLADNKLEELKKYQDYLVAGVDPERMSAATVSVIPDKKDDLTKIEGIGPKIEGLCHNAGIYTFQQLSVSSVEKLKVMLTAAGPRYQMHDPATWPAQAKLAANGKWDELKTMQDNLKGGKTAS